MLKNAHVDRCLQAYVKKAPHILVLTSFQLAILYFPRLPAQQGSKKWCNLNRLLWRFYEYNLKENGAYINYKRLTSSHLNVTTSIFSLKCSDSIVLWHYFLLRIQEKKKNAHSSFMQLSLFRFINTSGFMLLQVCRFYIFRMENEVVVCLRLNFFKNIKNIITVPDLLLKNRKLQKRRDIDICLFCI